MKLVTFLWWTKTSIWLVHPKAPNCPIIFFSSLVHSINYSNIKTKQRLWNSYKKHKLQIPLDRVNNLRKGIKMQARKAYEEFVQSNKNGVRDNLKQNWGPSLTKKEEQQLSQVICISEIKTWTRPRILCMVSPNTSSLPLLTTMML